MKISFSKFLLILFSLVFGYSHAADVLITVNGSITPESCNIDSRDVNKNVNIPDVYTQTFKKKGDVGTAENFKIRLNRCTSKLSKINYIFTGSQDEIDPELLKLNQINGETGPIADGIAIEILDKDMLPIALNEKKSLNSPYPYNFTELSFYVRYKATKDNVIAGNASSILYMDFYYE